MTNGTVHALSAKFAHHEAKPCDEHLRRNCILHNWQLIIAKRAFPDRNKVYAQWRTSEFPREKYNS